MKTIFRLSLLAALASVQIAGQAQAMTKSSKKPIAQTSCRDYMEMDETIRPKFIFYTVGYVKHGRPMTTSFDVVDVDKMTPVLDEYCRVNLTASAYEKVMKESIASEKEGK